MNEAADTLANDAGAGNARTLSESQIPLHAIQVTYKEAGKDSLPHRPMCAAAYDSIALQVQRWLRGHTQATWLITDPNSEWLQMTIKRKLLEKDTNLPQFIELVRTDRLRLPTRRFVDKDTKCFCCDEELATLEHFVLDCTYTTNLRWSWRNALRLMPPFQKKEELIERLIDGAPQSDTVPDLHMVAMVTGLVNFTMTPGEKPQIDKDTKHNTTTTRIRTYTTT